MPTENRKNGLKSVFLAPFGDQPAHSLGRHMVKEIVRKSSKASPPPYYQGWIDSLALRKLEGGRSRNLAGVVWTSRG